MKKIFLKLIILFLISITPVALYNYLYDPYSIFRNTNLNLWYPPGFEPNQHYAKMRHLISEDHSWDSYLFGASRVGKINTEAIPDGRYYNMNYSQGVPGEHLVDIQLLLKSRVPVKNVMIGVDNFSYSMRPEDHEGQIMRHPYDNSALKRLIFKIRYLYSVPRFIMMRYIRSNRENTLSINFNVLGNGVQNLKNVDMNIERDIESHITNKRFHAAYSIKYESVELMDDTIDDIAEIIKLSRRHDFNLDIFINPIHKLYYLHNDPNLFLLFKFKLAQITDFWDFSGLNSITTNNYYYYETSHYRNVVGDFIICRMTNCTNNKVPQDFGLFITKDNISNYIRNEKEKLITYNTDKFNQQ